MLYVCVHESGGSEGTEKMNKELGEDKWKEGERVKVEEVNPHEI